MSYVTAIIIFEGHCIHQPKRLGMVGLDGMFKVPTHSKGVTPNRPSQPTSSASVPPYQLITNAICCTVREESSKKETLGTPRGSEVLTTRHRRTERTHTSHSFPLNFTQPHITDFTACMGKVVLLLSQGSAAWNAAWTCQPELTAFTFFLIFIQIRVWGRGRGCFEIVLNTIFPPI